MTENWNGHEVMQGFRKEEKIHSLEQSRGIEGLNKICNALGYSEQPYRNGTSLEEFLRDNPGCCEAIVEWIENHLDVNDEWKESLSFEDDEETDSQIMDVKAEDVFEDLRETDELNGVIKFNDPSEGVGDPSEIITGDRL